MSTRSICRRGLRAPGAVLAAACLVLVGLASPAQARELEDIPVGRTCATLKVENMNVVYEVCDDQANSSVYPNWRKHGINAKAVRCPQTFYESRVRAAALSPYGNEPWSAESKRKNDPCPDHYLGLSSKTGSTVTVSLWLEPGGIGGSVTLPSL
ncbi:hypothetical protein AB0G05_45150 [Nonomuraea wenchangensis]